MCLRSRGQGCFIHKRPTMIRIVERLSGLRRLHHGTLLREARRSLYHLYGFATSVTYRTLPPKWRNNQSKNLSYGGSSKAITQACERGECWHAHSDSDREQMVLETTALPIKLRAHKYTSIHVGAAVRFEPTNTRLMRPVP